MRLRYLLANYKDSFLAIKFNMVRVMLTSFFLLLASILIGSILDSTLISVIVYGTGINSLYCYVIKSTYSYAPLENFFNKNEFRLTAVLLGIVTALLFYYGFGLYIAPVVIVYFLFSFSFTIYNETKSDFYTTIKNCFRVIRANFLTLLLNLLIVIVFTAVLYFICLFIVWLVSLIIAFTISTWIISIYVTLFVSLVVVLPVVMVSMKYLYNGLSVDDVVNHVKISSDDIK